jgi:hypothetical protein
VVVAARKQAGVGVSGSAAWAVNTACLCSLRGCALSPVACACLVTHHRGFRIAKPTFHMTIRLEERE